MSSDRQALLAHLDEQLLFLRSSSLAFDAGERHEAKRLAVAVRLLAHETKTSRSLLGQLKIRNILQYFDTTLSSAGYWRGDLEPTVHTGGLVEPSLGARVDRDWLPRCWRVAAPSAQRSSIDRWWIDGSVFRTAGSGPVNRRSAVLWLANKDGGAHVDALPPAYAELRHGGGIRVGGTTLPGRPAQSPIPEIVRQVSEELRLTIEDWKSHSI